MKVVKLDRRHKLYHEGFTHAVKFPSWSSEACRYELTMKKLYPNEYRPTGKGTYNWRGNEEWTYHWPQRTTYWIGVKHESTITQLMLSISYTEA